MRFLPLFVLLAVGCGAYQSGDKADYETSAGADSAVNATADGSALPNSEAIERKIIYTSDVDLVVEEFDDVPEKVEKLVDQFQGYLASSNISGSPGRPRSGRWTIRVPDDRADEFLAEVKTLGELRSIGSEAQDVTEEYYDLQGRLTGKKQTRERLQKHLEESTGKLEEILAVETQIERVQGEIEQMEGRMRVLKKLTALTTVNLTIDEIKDYEPEEAAGYLTRMRRAVGNSLSRLWGGAQNFSIGFVAALPWFLVFAVPLVVVWKIWKWRRRRGQ
ncbi:MAG: DUF4349 domain-containing protein [Candidatus Nealsonbacteria bacterium]|nr:DUF4349 domain-containing protein [Candidatus Nealsonbacteria bacterium]